ncbi:hypothetical protein TWF506_006847 [Arthrobotrys conoides]|uniref:Acyl-protein thioesterase 1 n=1 Tax=Arthrobotrys conoides TaxID=74498 RepID=A0AAN8P4I0_9PEZI
MAEHEPPRVIEAITRPHESTVIFLHGRGDSGNNVAPYLLYTPINSEHSETSRQNTDITLRNLLPHTKFLFPTALKRRLERLGSNVVFNQWFDMDSLEITDYYDDGQVEGVKESTDYIHGLIKAEIEAGIPPEKIVVMGISQGCATGAVAVMRYPARLGAFVGISGWLPFITEIENILRQEAEEEERDATAVLGYIEKRLGSDKEVVRENVMEMLKTPVFIGHGVGDTKILPKCGERLRDVMKGVKFEEVVWATYRVGHWWCDEELIHIAAWLGTKGFPVNGLEKFMEDDIGSLSTQGVSYSTN